MLAVVPPSANQKRRWVQEDAQRNRWTKLPWIPWGIEKNFVNLYPDKIELLFIRSSILRRVATDNAAAIVGEGLTFEGADKKQAAEMFAAAGVDLEFLTRCAQDISLFNGMAAQVSWANNPETGPFPASVRHQKIARVRVERTDETTGAGGGFYVSSDWAGVDSQGKPKQGWDDSVSPVRLPAYGTGKKVNLYYGSLYSPATDYYPLPDAESCYNALAVGIEIEEYQRRYVQNNMSLGAIIQAYFTPASTNPGQPLSEEDQQVFESLKRQYTDELVGVVNAGKTVVTFLDPRATTPDGALPEIKFIQPVEEHNDKKFLEVQNYCNQAALTGLGVVAKELYGLSSNSGFTSQSDQLITAFRLTERKTIAPKRAVLLEFLNRIASDMGLAVSVDLKPAPPISFQLTPDMVAAGIVTADEYRESIGLQPLTATIA